MTTAKQPIFFSGPKDADTRHGLALTYSWLVWAVALAGFIVTHFFLFSRVHNLVDTRVCIGYSPDPLMNLIPFDERWFIVTRQLYLAGLLISFALFFLQAVRGVETPLLRWGIALTFMTSLRMATITMIPLCRATLKPGGAPPLSRPEVLDLHYFSVPFRGFALNDLVYSGHTAVFILVFLASGTWNKKARFCVATFLLVMMYALIGTRGHYSVDILLAFPCAWFADSIAIGLLRFATKWSGSSSSLLAREAERIPAAG